MPTALDLVSLPPVLACHVCVLKPPMSHPGPSNSRQSDITSTGVLPKLAQPHVAASTMPL